MTVTAAEGLTSLCTAGKPNIGDLSTNPLNQQNIVCFLFCFVLFCFVLFLFCFVFCFCFFVFGFVLFFSDKLLNIFENNRLISCYNFEKNSHFNFYFYIKHMNRLWYAIGRHKCEVKCERGCSSAVERTLCMCEAPGSIPGSSIFWFWKHVWLFELFDPIYFCFIWFMFLFMFFFFFFFVLFLFVLFVCLFV